MLCDGSISAKLNEGCAGAFASLDGGSNGREFGHTMTWLANLPVAWMALVIFAGAYIVAAAICTAVLLLAKGDRGPALKAVSPGLLPVFGILFALFVAFTASQVWNDNAVAESAVAREASALRATLVLASSFPGEAA